MISLTDILTLLPESFLTVAICALLLLDVFLRPAQRSITHYLAIAILGVALGWVVLTILARIEPRDPPAAS